MEKQAITPESLLLLGKYFTIKKHEKNKIRLSVDLAIRKLRFQMPEGIVQAKLKWEVLLQALPGITTVKPRLLILAVDIEYDDATIPVALWEAWVNAETTPELSAYVQTAFDQAMAHLTET